MIRFRGCGPRFSPGGLIGRVILFLVASVCSRPVFATHAVNVYGWPVPNLDEPRPSLALGDDPVVGRLACPSLARLNLSKGASEPLLLTVLRVEAGANHQVIWGAELLRGITWWNGSLVTAEDLAAFFNRELPAIVREKGIGLWALPPFHAVTHGERTVRIIWDRAPAFGPFILDGVSLWRPAAKADGKAIAAGKKGGEALAFECAGMYKAETTPNRVVLTPVRAPATMPRVNLFRQRPEFIQPSGQGDPWLEFRFAKSFSANPRSSAASCRRPLDLAMISAIVWNPHAPLAASPDLRRIYTELTPRGELLRAGADSLGKLLSAPIPRASPGYDRGVLVRPFDLEQAAKDLEHLGYKRAVADRLRRSSDGKEMRLRIIVNGATQGIAEKVIGDSFAAVGIAIDFERGDGTAKQAAAADGVLTGLLLPWPSLDFLSNFHSAAALGYPFWSLRDKTLDGYLAAYAASLTRPTPDFRLLQRVHQRLFQLEPMTVLLQHDACLESGPGRDSHKASVDVGDPDWFRKLL